MKIKIKKKEFKTVEVEKEYELPSAPCYYFITGERNSYCVLPRFTTWENEPKLYEYDIVQIGLSFKCEISAYSIRVHDIPDILKDHKKQGHEIIKNIVECPEYGIRTQNQFMDDFNSAMMKLKQMMDKNK